MEISSINQLSGARGVEPNSKTQGSIEKLKSANLSSANEKELMEACKDFEAYFVEKMFQEMKKTVPESTEETGSSKTMMEYFEDGLVQEYASSATQTQSLGLAQVLFEQMKRNYGL